MTGREVWFLAECAVSPVLCKVLVMLRHLSSPLCSQSLLSLLLRSTAVRIYEFKFFITLC